MSAKTAGGSEEVSQPGRRSRGFLSWKGMRLALSLGVAACMAVVLPLSTATAASAAPVSTSHHGGGDDHGKGSGWEWGYFHHGKHFSISGIVTGSVSSSGFQVTVGAKPWALTSTGTTITVTVTPTTLYIEPGQSTPGINGVMTGDHVKVVGTPTGATALTALVVDVPLVSYTGTVGTITGGTFPLTVTSWSNRGKGWEDGEGHWFHPPRGLTSTSTTIDVTLGTNTQYREPGQSSPGPSGVMTGDTVSVVGVQQGTDTHGNLAVNALLVTVPLARYAGLVSGVGTGGFTLTVFKTGNVAVAVNSSTKYFEPGASSPTVVNGDHVGVVGTQAGSLAVTALTVVINPGDDHGHGPGYGGGPGSGGGHHHGRR